MADPVAHPAFDGGDGEAVRGPPIAGLEKRARGRELTCREKGSLAGAFVELADTFDMEQAIARLRRHDRNHNLRLTDVANAVSTRAARSDGSRRPTGHAWRGVVDVQAAAV